MRLILCCFNQDKLENDFNFWRVLIPLHAKLFITLIKSLCQNNPQNVISLDPDTDQYYVLTPQPTKKDPPLLFEPTQVQTAISPNSLLPKMQVFILEKNSNTFGIVLFLPNTQRIL